MKRLMIEIVDSMFIMILCFTTLFTAMLMKSRSAFLLDYNINYETLFITMAGFMVCISFIIKHSERGLGDMLEKIYTDETD